MEEILVGIYITRAVGVSSEEEDVESADISTFCTYRSPSSLLLTHAYAFLDQTPPPGPLPYSSRPLNLIQFQDWRLYVKLCGGVSMQIDDALSFSIQDPWTNCTSSMMHDLIAEKYQDFEDYHPGLISYYKVEEWVKEDLRISLDLTKHEMGYVLLSPGPGLQSTYSAISSRDPELSLRSALSSMFYR